MQHLNYYECTERIWRLNNIPIHDKVGSKKGFANKTVLSIGYAYIVPRQTLSRLVVEVKEACGKVVRLHCSFVVPILVKVNDTLQVF